MITRYSTRTNAAFKQEPRNTITTTLQHAKVWFTLATTTLKTSHDVTTEFTGTADPRKLPFTRLQILMWD